MTAIVAAADLTRRYGEGEVAVDALRDVTVEFAAGRFAAIMGPSGSGKSTLMHLLAGLDRPTSGTVTLDGTELETLDDRALTLLRREKWASSSRPSTCCQFSTPARTSCCRCRSPAAARTMSGSIVSSTPSASATG